MTDITIQTKPIPQCPECYEPMVLRKPKHGQTWRPFWGCSDYPDCQGTRKIMPDGTPEEDDWPYDHDDDWWAKDPDEGDR